MLQKNHPYYLIFLFVPIFLLVSTSVKSQIDDLDNSIQDSMSSTISQVNNIDLGEAKSELAEGIDEAMGKMGEGMEFALQALEGGDAETALKTMEMLESTMDMAIGAIPKEEFMDFSRLKLDDFSPEELAAAQSMMGDMMAQSMGAMTSMMENMSHVEGAGFDMSGFMGTMDKSGFGFETMFSENMESMGSMFGEDMSMMGMMEGMDMSPEMMSAFTMDPESMNMSNMMESMGAMGDMSEMMSEHMDFGSFADMAGMMDGDQMDMMTEGMMEMMGKGSFDGFAGSMTMMGNMIKGEGPEGMGEEGEGDFFGDDEQNEEMMTMMSTEMDHMGEAFGEMSEDQMGMFMKGMGEDSAMMNIGEMSSMGMDMGDMANMSMDMGMDMSDMGMDMGGMDMGGMGDMMGGDMMGDMGGMMEGMSETMGEAFGGGSGDGGMISEGGMQGGGDQGGGERKGDPPKYN